MDKKNSDLGKFLFDEPVDRRNTGAIKYDAADRFGVPRDAIPMWVADMDFRSPACVSDALVRRTAHGIYGYSDMTDGYISAVRGWWRRRYAYKVDETSIVTTPGVVFALYTAVSALTEPGDSVLIQRPVYGPFSRAVEDLGRKLVSSALVLRNGRYEIDFEDFERRIAEEKVRLFILSNPHNPVGRVWTLEELRKIGEICLRHQVFVVSDEIHSDFVYPGHSHSVFASLSPEISAITITCTAPSKTFNLAGLQISNLFIADDLLRTRFKTAMQKTGYSQPNLMGMIACQAAYEGGEAWLEALLAYLGGNIARVREAVAKDLPGVLMIEPEGTYLLWLDFSALGLPDRELRDKIEKKCGVWLDPGTVFGPEGSGFQRMNIACPEATLNEALRRMKRGLFE